MRNTIQCISLLLGLWLVGTNLTSQESLVDLLEVGESVEQNFTPATFKGSRLINGHTVMIRHGGSFEFVIAHRFGKINSGIYELFGLDNANIRFGLEYSLFDWLALGAGRSSFEKTYDGYIKLAALRQQTGRRNIPISVTLLATAAVQTLKNEVLEQELSFSDRWAYTFQALVARKFSPGFSLQLMPTLVHRNLVEAGRNNDLAALGAGFRIKITRRISINVEYYYRFSERDVEDRYDPIAFGIDLETGGHVFQLQFTNSRAMIEKGFIRETTGDFFSGDIHFGFNITRTF